MTIRARLFISLPLLALAVCARSRADTALPVRSSVAVVDYKGAWVPIAAADGNSPIIDSDGKPVTLDEDANIDIRVGKNFVDGFVAISDTKAFEMLVPDPDQFGKKVNTKSSKTVFEATLTSVGNIANAYATLVIIPVADNPDRSLSIEVRQVGDLPAGKQIAFHTLLPPPRGKDVPAWTILIFAEGRQVPSTGMAAILPGYLDGREHAALRVAIAERSAKGIDAPLGVFRRMPLGLPPAITDKYKGQTLKVELAIAVDGSVSSLKTVGMDDPDLTDALKGGLGFWLFLPAVKGGHTVASQVVLPLKL